MNWKGLDFNSCTDLGLGCNICIVAVLECYFLLADIQPFSALAWTKQEYLLCSAAAYSGILLCWFKQHRQHYYVYIICYGMDRQYTVRNTLLLNGNKAEIFSLTIKIFYDHFLATPACTWYSLYDASKGGVVSKFLLLWSCLLLKYMLEWWYVEWCLLPLGIIGRLLVACKYCVVLYGSHVAVFPCWDDS